MDDDGTYDYQVCGIRAETWDTEKFAWVSNVTHGTLAAAQEEAERIRETGIDDRVWIERRSNVWEEVP